MTLSKKFEPLSLDGFIFSCRCLGNFYGFRQAVAMENGETLNVQKCNDSGDLSVASLRSVLLFSLFVVY